jgi:hypothetical protein
VRMHLHNTNSVLFHINIWQPQEIFSK